MDTSSGRQVMVLPDANFTRLAGIGVDPKKMGSRYEEYRKRWNNAPCNFDAGFFPIHLDIESTSLCNLRCVFCDKLPLLTKNKMGSMDLGLYKSILDEAKEHDLCSVKLSYRGEPLVHSEIAEMVAYAKQSGVVDIYFNTNGMLLGETIVNRLIDAGLDRISVSIEGTDEKAFEAARVGAIYKVILQNVERLMAIKSMRGVDFPHVRVQTVRLPGIDLDDYAQFWKDKCDEVGAIDFKDVEGEKASIEAPWACPQLWQRMTIEWDGTVHPCNNDDEDKFALGKVPQERISELWRAECVERARAFHARGDSHMVEACQTCPYRQTQILKLLHKI